MRTGAMPNCPPTTKYSEKAALGYAVPSRHSTGSGHSAAMLANLISPSQDSSLPLGLFNIYSSHLFQNYTHPQCRMSDEEDFRDSATRLCSD
jgi:hypothetical protein